MPALRWFTGSRQGMSLMMVLAVVSILAFLAATMSALFLFNVNFAQGSFNGQTALSQAEAGLQEVIYKISQDPTLSLGTAGTEDFLGSVAPEFGMNDSYYRVTFNRSAGVPYSTNNVDKAHSTGYLGRTVPEGCIHVFSTGFCRGQWRTIEALLRQPPCPFGVASTGPILSHSPLVVAGTDSVTAYQSHHTDRPGHVVSNSPGGVRILRGNAPPGEDTKITGFIKTPGNISVEQPAEVWGGLRPNSSVCQIPDFKIKDLDPVANHVPGVFRINESVHGAQNLDVIYYSDHSIEYDGRVNLNNAFLYVQGNLTIVGGLGGVGSVVVDGDVNIRGDVALSGSNEVALLASGTINLQGAGNYFQGYLYSRTGIIAENLVVLGSMIVNTGIPSDPSGGSIDLDHVTVISDQSSGSFNFTAQSYSWGGSTTPQSVPRGDYLQVNAPGHANGNFWITLDDPQFVTDYVWWLAGGDNGPATTANPISDPNVAYQQGKFIVDNGFPEAAFLPPPPGATPPQAPSFAGLDGKRGELSTAIQNYEQALNMSAANATEQAAKDQAIQTASAALVGAFNGYIGEANSWAQDYFNFAKSHTAGNGTIRNEPGALPPDVHYTYNLQLNRYIPKSDVLQMTYWHVTPSRL